MFHHFQLKVGEDMHTNTDWSSSSKACNLRLIDCNFKTQCQDAPIQISCLCLRNVGLRNRKNIEILFFSFGKTMSNLGKTDIYNGQNSVLDTCRIPRCRSNRVSYMFHSCQKPSSGGTFGNNVQNMCQCQNGDNCHPQNGSRWIFKLCHDFLSSICKIVVLPKVMSCRIV